MAESSSAEKGLTVDLQLPDDVVAPGKCSSTEYLKFNWPPNSTMISLHARVVDIGEIRETRSKFIGEMQQVLGIVLANDNLDLVQLTAWQEFYVRRLSQGLVIGGVSVCKTKNFSIIVCFN